MFILISSPVTAAVEEFAGVVAEVCSLFRLSRVVVVVVVAVEL